MGTSQGLGKWLRFKVPKGPLGLGQSGGAL